MTDLRCRVKGCPCRGPRCPFHDRPPPRGFAALDRLMRGRPGRV